MLFRSIGCRRGGCGMCRIRIVKGEWTGGVMSRAHVSEEQEKSGYALACRVRPFSDLVIEVPGRNSK